MNVPLGSTAQSAELTTHGWVKKRVRDELDTAEGSSQERFDRVARLGRQLFGVSSAEIRLFNHDRQWARPFIEPRDGVHDDPFAAAARDEPGILMITDASEDPRLWDAPAVVADPGVVFFASVPILDPSGYRIGAFELADPHTRVLTEAEQMLLREIAGWIESEILALEELERAAAVQRSLSPKAVTGIDGYEVAGACAPARAVGGDFYDWYTTPDGAAFTLADVMGKGVGAAIIAATVRAVMRAGSRGADIKTTLDMASEALDSDLDDTSTFVTMVHGRLDPSTGRIRYIDAGHGLSMHMTADLRCHRLTSTDLPLGIQPVATWTEHSFVLEPGDTAVSVSDGVLDAFGGSLIGLEEIEAIIIDTTTAQEAVDEILRRAAFGADDDVTALVVRRLPV